MRYNKTMIERAREFYLNVGLGNMEFGGFSVKNSWGMCSQVERYALLNCEVYDEFMSNEFSHVMGAINRFSQRWYLFSGDPEFPVPGGIDAYYENSIEHTMYVGEYGEYRKELARYLNCKLANITLSNATEAGLWAITQYQIRRVLVEAASGKLKTHLGLCFLMGKVVAHLPTSQINAYHLWKGACFESWPRFSGDATYPVPAPDYDETPQGAFTMRYNKYEGEYGQSRIDLALHLLDNLDF